MTDQLHVFGTESERNAEDWISNIFRAVVHYKYVDHLISKHEGMALNKNLMLSHVLSIILSEKAPALDISESNQENPKNEADAGNSKEMNTLEGNGKVKSPKALESKQDDMQTVADTLGISLEELKEFKIGLKSFDILKRLGSGAFGTVYKVKLKSTGKIYAMKVLKKKALMQHNQLRYAAAEANILKMANSPFIISLHFAFQVDFFPIVFYPAE